GAALARQLGAIAATIDGIFPPITGNSVLTQLMAALRYEGARRDAAVMAAERALAEEIRRALQMVTSRLDGHDQRLDAPDPRDRGRRGRGSWAPARGGWTGPSRRSPGTRF